MLQCWQSLCCFLRLAPFRVGSRGEGVYRIWIYKRRPLLLFINSTNIFIKQFLNNLNEKAHSRADWGLPALRSLTFQSSNLPIFQSSNLPIFKLSYILKSSSKRSFALFTLVTIRPFASVLVTHSPLALFTQSIIG